MTRKQFIEHLLNDQLTHSDIKEAILDFTDNLEELKIEELRFDIEVVIDNKRRVFFDALIENINHARLFTDDTHKNMVSCEIVESSLYPSYEEFEYSLSKIDEYPFEDKLISALRGGENLESFFKPFISELFILGSAQKELIDLCESILKVDECYSVLEDLISIRGVRAMSVNTYIPQKNARKLLINFLAHEVNKSNLSFALHHLRNNKLMINADRFDRQLIDSITDFVTRELNYVEEFYVESIDSLGAIRSQKNKFTRLRNEAKKLNISLQE